MAKTVHYVGTLIIRRIEVEDLARNGDPGRRKIGDVLNLIVRGKDIAALLSKITEHANLVEDDLSIPLDDDRVTRG